MIATASIALMPIRTVDQVKIGSSARTDCVNWAHEQCTDVGRTNFIFVCHHCDSD